MSKSQRQLEVQCEHKLRNGDTLKTIRVFLVAEGASEDVAERMVFRAYQRLRNQALITLVLGVIAAGVGTVVSMSTFTNGPVQFEFFWWGPILFGTIAILIGIVKLLKIWTR